MNFNLVKWLILVALFFLTLIFAILPLHIVGKFENTLDNNRRAKYGRLISLLNCFAGGVFMATCLLDLLPDTSEILKNGLSKMSINTTFPVTEFTVTIGFFLVLLTEQIALYFQEHKHNTVIFLDSQPDDRGNRAGNLDGLTDSLAGSNVSDTLSDSESHSVLRSVLLLVALSMHSLFEGIAIGLQPKLDSILQIFFAVIIHKVIIAFSLGLNLVQSQMKLKSIVKSIFGFCIVSPLGMAIAMCIEEFCKNLNFSVINGLLQGLACGTFVYITFFEILPLELNKRHDRLLKLISLLFGFSLITLVILYQSQHIKL